MLAAPMEDHNGCQFVTGLKPVRFTAILLSSACNCPANELEVELEVAVLTTPLAPLPSYVLTPGDLPVTP